MIKGDPAGRRKFLDTLLAQTSSVYLESLQKYRKVLKEKNILLKYDKIDDTLLSAYNTQLARYGAHIFIIRNSIITKIDEIIRRIYKKFSGGKDELMIQYSSLYNKVESVQYQTVCTEFQNALETEKNVEKKKRNCLLGPHLDDVTFFLNGKSVKSYASEGQKRAIALSLRIAECEIVESVFREPPVVLLDDVFGELDPEKKRILNEMFKPEMQMFITCTRYQDVTGLIKNAKRFSVYEGKISAE